LLFVIFHGTNPQLLFVIFHGTNPQLDCQFYHNIFVVWHTIKIICQIIFSFKLIL
jgi:hypothetical protein